MTWRLHRLQADLEPHERTIAAEALHHFDRQRYDLVAYVVMSDHVHVIVTPRGEWALASITHTWKSFTAWRLRRERGRKGKVWQNESYDRIVRDPTACVRW